MSMPQHRISVCLSLIGTTLLLAGTLLAAEPPTNQAVAILENLEFPAGEPVAYEETQMNPMLKQPVSQQGFVEITTNGAFVMQVTTPRPEQRRLENGKLSLTRPSKTALRRNPSTALANARTRTLTLNPKHGGHLVLLAITQLLSGDITALMQNFQLQSSHGKTCQFVESCEAWRIVLTPKNAKVKKRLLSIELNGVNDRLHSLYTQRSSEAWQRLTFITSQP